MPVDNNGVYQYTNDDTLNNWATFMNLGMSSVSTKFSGVNRNYIYTAASQAAADSLRTAKGSSAASPLFVFRTDTKGLMFHNGTVWAEVVPTSGGASVSASSTAGQVSFGSVAGGGAIEKTITFPEPVVVSEWLPFITLDGTRHSVDSLTGAVFEFTSTQLKVVIKNTTSIASTDTNRINWMLVRKGA